MLFQKKKIQTLEHPFLHLYSYIICGVLHISSIKIGILLCCFHCRALFVIIIASFIHVTIIDVAILFIISILVTIVIISFSSISSSISTYDFLIVIVDAMMMPCALVIYIYISNCVDRTHTKRKMHVNNFMIYQIRIYILKRVIKCFSYQDIVHILLIVFGTKFALELHSMRVAGNLSSSRLGLLL